MPWRDGKAVRSLTLIDTNPTHIPYFGPFPFADESFGVIIALLVTKWVHTIEIAILDGAQASPRERELLTMIDEILQEAEYNPSASVSLAAGVATTWGWLLQDVSTASSLRYPPAPLGTPNNRARACQGVDMGHHPSDGRGS